MSERKTNNRDQLIDDEKSKRYLLTELDDIVYNPANLKYGAIDRNKYGRGVISPIYVTFVTSEVPEYIERLVTSDRFRIKALKYEEGSVVKRQAVNPEIILGMEEYISPHVEEQRAIGVLFERIDIHINRIQKQIALWQSLKKALLQQMFV